MTKRKKRIIALGVILIAVGVAAGVYLMQSASKKTPVNVTPQVKSSPQSKQEKQPQYNMTLASGNTYEVSTATSLKFRITDEAGRVFKDFDNYDGAPMHLIIVRKDRSYYQHHHPSMNENSGLFEMDKVNFPADGEYRVYASFTSKKALTSIDGRQMISSPHQDVKVGDLNKYSAQSLGPNRTTNTAGGVSMSFAPITGDQAFVTVYTQRSTLMGISLEKNGKPYNAMQKYMGSIGHVAIIGPNLELVRGAIDNPVEQSGILLFLANFPAVGQYKVYLQTSIDNQVQTTDFVYSVETEGTPQE